MKDALRLDSVENYERFFEYNSHNPDELIIISVDNGKNSVEDALYDPTNNLIWIKDYVTSVTFKDDVIRTAVLDHDEWVVFSSAELKVKDFVLRKLGHPLVRVELTLQQLKDSIDETIEEIAPWVVQPEFITVNTNSQIDLSEYNISYIINVVPADRDVSGGIQNGGVTDIFAVGYYGTSGYREAFYSQLELGLLNRNKESISGGVSWKFIDRSSKLLIDVGSTDAKRVTIEYSPKIKSIDDLTEDIYVSFAKKFALAFSRATLSDIRGKFRVEGSPVELDSSEQSDKSNSELERLREELKNTVSTHFSID